MKINAITIFGLCVVGAGVLFLLFALFWGGGSASDAAARPSGWGYFFIAGGIILSGMIIAGTGQLVRAAPKPTDRL